MAKNCIKIGNYQTNITVGMNVWTSCSIFTCLLPAFTTSSINACFILSLNFKTFIFLFHYHYDNKGIAIKVLLYDEQLKIKARACSVTLGFNSSKMHCLLFIRNFPYLVKFPVNMFFTSNWWFRCTRPSCIDWGSVNCLSGEHSWE
jgi:hypothetical protein